MIVMHKKINLAYHISIIVWCKKLIIFSSSISKHTMVYSWAPYTLYGARYVMVDYLIKTEQRALMGSYHASWGPFERGVEATVLHCWLFLINYKHFCWLQYFNQSSSPQLGAQVKPRQFDVNWVYLTYSTMNINWCKVIFYKQTGRHLLIVVLRPISTLSTLVLTLSTLGPEEMCTWPCPNHFLDPANTTLSGGDFDKAPPYLEEEYTKPLMFSRPRYAFVHALIMMRFV